MSETVVRQESDSGGSADIESERIFAYLMALVLVAGSALLVILFVPIPYLSPTATGPSWIPLVVVYILMGVTMASFLTIAALVWRGHRSSRGPGGRRRRRRPGGGDPDPSGEDGDGKRHPIRIILLLLIVAGVIVVGYTILYLRFAKFGRLSGFYYAVGALATVQAPPEEPATVGVIGITQELVDLVFISGVVSIALGRAFN
jgi:hypothetical protein